MVSTELNCSLHTSNELEIQYTVSLHTNLAKFDHTLLRQIHFTEGATNKF